MQKISSKPVKTYTIGFDEDDFDLYFDYDFVPPCQKHRLRIKGKGVTSLILNDNFELLSRPLNIFDTQHLELAYVQSSPLSTCYSL